MQKSNSWIKERNSDLSAGKLDEVFNHVKIENKEVGYVNRTLLFRLPDSSNLLLANLLCSN